MLGSGETARFIAMQHLGVEFLKGEWISTELGEFQFLEEGNESAT